MKLIFISFLIPALSAQAAVPTSCKNFREYSAFKDQEELKKSYDLAEAEFNRAVEEARKACQTQAQKPASALMKMGLYAKLIGEKYGYLEEGLEQMRQGATKLDKSANNSVKAQSGECIEALKKDQAGLQTRQQAAADKAKTVCN